MRMRREHSYIAGYCVVLLMLATMGYLAGDYTIRKNQLQHATSSADKQFMTDVSYVPLPRMSMTMASKDKSTGRVRIDISLEVEQKNLGRLEDFQPIITDRLINYVRNMNMDDMRKPDAMPTLRRDLLKQVNGASFPVPVLDVIFRQFIIM